MENNDKNNTHICKFCHKSFTSLYSKETNGDFCSLLCARRYSSSFNKGKTKNEICIKCGVKIIVPINSAFPCCDSCRKQMKRERLDRRNAKKRKGPPRKSPRHRGKKIPVSDGHCINCGKNISVYKKYCSCKCQQDHQKKEKYKIIEKNNGNGFTHRAIRKYIFNTREHKCAICGLTEWLGKPILLIMDHIDGHANNNSLDNIRLICSNCDATLPTYKSKNKNSDRAFRHKYYSESGPDEIQPM